MKDNVATRIQIKAVTSYAADKNIDYSAKNTSPTIVMTLGSCKLTLIYSNDQDRNFDMTRLDQQIGTNDYV